MLTGVGCGEELHVKGPGESLRLGLGRVAGVPLLPQELRGAQEQAGAQRTNEYQIAA